MKLWEKYHLRNSEEYYFTPARMATMKGKKGKIASVDEE